MCDSSSVGHSEQHHAGSIRTGRAAGGARPHAGTGPPGTAAAPHSPAASPRCPRGRQRCLRTEHSAGHGLPVVLHPGRMCVFMLQDSRTRSSGRTSSRLLGTCTKGYSGHLLDSKGSRSSHILIVGQQAASHRQRCTAGSRRRARARGRPGTAGSASASCAPSSRRRRCPPAGSR
jgi:hypothetical protein